MSIDATRWAWQKVVRPTRKLVLLSLADRADEYHSCYPSIDRLSADTGLNRKTIIECIKDLQNNGILNAKRRWGSKSEYTLIGVPDRHLTSTKNGTGTKNGMSTSTKNGTSIENRSVNLSTNQSYTDQLCVRAKILMKLYVINCPSGMPINPEIQNDVILQKTKKALDAHSSEWWSAVFARAEASDYLAGKIAAGDGRYFKMKFGWIVQTHVAKTIASGKYDNHKERKHRVNRDPSSEWDQTEVHNV